jgi:hypothetical protein
VDDVVSDVELRKKLALLMAIPTRTRATALRFYKYSSLEKPEQLDWLNAIILEHRLYFPNLSQLNDPADGRPKLVPKSVDEMVSFLYNDFLRSNPNLSRDAQEREKAIIHFNSQRYGSESIQRMMAGALYKELNDYRIYSMSKRYDNLGMWAKYAANHSGYCLEFANEGLFSSACEVIYGEYLLDLNDEKERSNSLFFFYKSQDWSNEDEVRLLLIRGSNPVVTIEPHWLTRLILGEKMSESHQQIIREWAARREPQLSVVSAYYDELHQVLRLR